MSFPDPNPSDQINWDHLGGGRVPSLFLEKYWEDESSWDIGFLDGDQLEGLEFEFHGYMTSVLGTVNPHLFFQPNKTTLLLADMWETHGSNPTTAVAGGYSTNAAAPGIVLGTTYPNSLAVGQTGHVHGKSIFQTRFISGAYQSFLSEYMTWNYSNGNWSLAHMAGVWKDQKKVNSGKIVCADFASGLHKFRGYMSVRSLR